MVLDSSRVEQLSALSHLRVLAEYVCLPLLVSLTLLGIINHCLFRNVQCGEKIAKRVGKSGKSNVITVGLLVLYVCVQWLG